MLIQKCLNPKIHYDWSSHQFITIACGRCQNCLQKRRSNWSEKIVREYEDSACAYFFTLTYDNDHIPALIINEYHQEQKEFDVDGNIIERPYRNGVLSLSSYNDGKKKLSVVSNADTGYHCVLSPFSWKRQDIREDDICLDLADYFTEDYLHKHVEFPFLVDKKRSPYVKLIGYARKKDLQNYFKRLRSRLSYNREHYLDDVPKKERTFRYFAVSEYGPQTSRPHYHGILFFRNRRVGQAVYERYFRECWKYAADVRKDISLIVDKRRVSQYVSKYITKDINDTPLFQFAPFTPFVLYSKTPALGNLRYNLDSITDQIDKHTLTSPVYYPSKDGIGKTFDVSIPKSAINNFFPRPFRASSLNNERMVAALSKCLEYANIYLAHHPRELTEQFKFGSLFPNLVTYVKRKYNLHSKREIDLTEQYKTEGCAFMYSQIYDKLSEEEYWYGIPQNRHWLACGLKYCLLRGYSPLDYVREYCRVYLYHFNDQMRTFIDYQNSVFSSFDLNLRSSLAKFCCIFPTFYKSLPDDLQDERSQTVINRLSPVASLYDVNIRDFYDEEGVLLSLISGQYIYRQELNLDELQMYTDYISDRKKRNAAQRYVKYFQNQNDLNF